MVGGVELYVQRMGAELTTLGYDVHVFTPDSVLRHHMPRDEETVDGMQVHRIHVPIDLSYRLKIWPGLTDALVKLHPGLIHVYSHDSYALFAQAAANKTRLPLLMTTYGPFETHRDYGWLEAGLFRLYDSMITPRLFRGCAAIFVRYPELLSWITSLSVDPSRIHVEPSGIPRAYLDLPADGSSFREQIHLRGPMILYVGRISPQKGVHYALEAMVSVTKKFPDARLVVVGPDYTGFSSYLRSRAQELGISENVMLLEPVSSEAQEVEILTSCDVFVMPSSFEGFSQAVMKAMARGRPVVVTNVGGLPYEVKYGECGIICEYGNPEALGQEIIGVLESRNNVSEMGKRARLQAESFTFDKLAAKVSNVYRSILA